MPLRDHLRPPVSTRSSWEGFHGGWPMTIVQVLSRRLPENFTAEPRVHLGTYFEVDVCTFEGSDNGPPAVSTAPGAGGTAAATYAPPEPTFAVETELPEEYEYEVLVYDQSRDRQLVAAVEIVSPANKDRPQSRRTFVDKCLALLKKGVCVSIVDLVTVRHFNLYADLLDLLGEADPTFSDEPPTIYAATCRGLPAEGAGRKQRLETWAYPLRVGEPLPELPIWLTGELAVSLQLEESYEEACRALRIA